MNELVIALLVWIAWETDLPIAPPPVVAIVSKEEMSERAYGRAWQASDDIPAAYDNATRTVYLRDDWKPAELRSRARLLHELVHHVQSVNELPYDCPARREPIAYHLALKWLHQQGASDPYEALGIDEFSIWIRSRCQDEG